MFLALLGLPSLLAFAPSDTVYQGIEPRRVMPYVASTQARLRAQPAWQRFVAGEGVGWTARFDPLTGTATSASGPGLPMGMPTTRDGLDKAVRGFLGRHEDLLGVTVRELRLRNARNDARSGIAYVEYDRVVDGVPVWGAGVRATLKYGNLVLLNVDTYPDAPHLGAASIPSAEALSVAMDEGPAPLADHREGSARLVLLPLPVANDVAWHLAWEVRTRTEDPPGKWVSFVDAQDGTLLHVYNEVRFLDGVVQGVHDTRTVDGRTSTSPMPLISVRPSSGSTVTADDAGLFSIGTNDGTVALRGSWLTVNNEGGREGSLSFSGTTTPTFTTSAATEAEIDTWVFLHHVKAWAEIYAPDAGIINEGFTSNVNLGDVCNAYYDGSVNFFQAGGGCNNSGRIADVAYHEWGHGLHYTSLLAGTFDGSISEGIGDIVAAMQTLDSTVAPNFGTDGSSIREIGADRVYPDDVVNEVHEDGLIFAGAAWDLLGNLAASYGESATVKGTGWGVASGLLATAIQSGPTIPQSYDAYVVADDDDGDLGNGTPHLCELVDAFSRHGLGPTGGTALVALDHASLGNQPADAPVAVTGTITNLAPTCVDFTLARAELVYSTDDGGSWDVAPLGVSGSGITGAFGGFPAGTVVQYYLRAQGADGTEVQLPAGGTIAPYTFYVGDLQEIYCERFDGGDDGGYTHELLSGRDQEGADDWIVGTPGGMSGDPDAAFSGRRVWGNDLGGGNYNGAYQPDITNRLSSPAIDVSQHDQVIVQYRRWLNVEDGIYDVASVYANDEAVWTNHATNNRQGDEHTQDTDWVLHTLVLGGVGDSLTLGWEVDSDSGLEFGGWNIDDVCVYAVAAPEVAPRVDDFAASDDEVERVTLSWTQPDVEGVSTAVVVRRDDRFGETRDDGEVVFVATDLTPGETIVAIDTYVGEGYYAVYTGDGAAFMTGAVEGENADRGAGLETDAGVDLGGDELQIKQEGCGCATPTGPQSLGGFGWVVAAIAGGFAARRRR